jgi:hypothetical protein
VSNDLPRYSYFQLSERVPDWPFFELGFSSFWSKILKKSLCMTFFGFTLDFLKSILFQSLKEAFKIFDKNRNGYIEAKELKAVTTTLGQSLTNEEFEAFWKEADVNGDGKLDYEEFIKIMSQY